MKTLKDIWNENLNCQCDKGDVHTYLPIYEELMAPYRGRPGLRLLEIGVFKGQSIRMWERYFGPDATIYGIDCELQPVGGMADLRPMIAEGTHHIMILNANSKAELDQHLGDLKFDIIVEDASHALEHQLGIYANLRDRLTPDGLYVIEDIDRLDSVRQQFLTIDPSRRVRIFDNRGIRGRFDDVLVVIGGIK